MRKSKVAPPPDERAARILIVDDDSRNLLALSEVLSPIAPAVCVDSGANALRELLRGDFAVILLDVFMPGLDGYETAALIREREQSAKIPIIFVSAVNKETEHLLRGYEMGAADYVFKPVDPVILRSKASVFVDLYNMRRQLENSERRQASVLRALPMAIYEAAEQENGQTRQDFVGGDLQHFLGEATASVMRGERQWQEFIEPEDRSRIEDLIAAKEDALGVEYRLTNPQGERRHILDQRVLTGTVGGRKQWAGTLLDITERKELEARLVHSGKLDALGQLTGGVAHDFNNLLATITGGINILQRRLQLGPSEQQVVDHMRHAAEQGAELIRRMMAFGRQQDLTPTSIDPTSLCESVGGLVSHTLGGMVTIAWECPVGDLNVFVDRGQLELALMNLIINARDAMVDGGEITVSIHEHHDSKPDKPTLRICVKDTGNGIPPDVVSKVTEPFFTTKETGKGTGLGLSMVSGFVNQSGGELRIESAVGAGTTIEMILPATTQKARSSTTTEDFNADWLMNKRMMLIDDDRSVLTVLAEQLRDAGGIVEPFSSGHDAIDAVSRQPNGYDFVLSDFAMPGIDGLATLKRLRRLAPNARMALMTGNAEDARLGENPAFPVIRKPLDLEDIAKAYASQLPHLRETG